MKSTDKLTRNLRTSAIVNTASFGVSFSLKVCTAYNIDWEACLSNLIELGMRRFRIMSYWDLHEQTKGQYDFSLLDQQLEILRKARVKATLCLGMRQPRWPESHIPKWALPLTEDEREIAYMAYHEAVIERYKGMDHIESWQLENEFWNRGFGLNNTFSRTRLKREYKLIRALDPERPIIMSLANTFGLPILGPKPDIFGTTLYLTQYEKGEYTPTKFKPWYFALRAFLVKLIGRRPLVIHELQAEPWGPEATQNLSDQEQAKSMSPEQLKLCVEFARKTGIKYMDLWGGEWWYWRKVKSQDVALWAVAKSETLESRHHV